MLVHDGWTWELRSRPCLRSPTRPRSGVVPRPSPASSHAALAWLQGNALAFRGCGTRPHVVPRPCRRRARACSPRPPSCPRTRSSSTSRTAWRSRRRRPPARTSPRARRFGTLAVRINASARRGRRDLDAVADASPGRRRPPKVGARSPALLPAGVALEVQIETARGLVEVERIAAAGGPLEALVFGPGRLRRVARRPGADDRRRRVGVRARADRGRRTGPRAPGGRRSVRRARRRGGAARVGGAGARARLRRQVGDPPATRSRR